MARNTTKARNVARNAGKAEKAKAATKARNVKAEAKARNVKAKVTAKAEKAKATPKAERSTKPGTGLQFADNARIVLKVETNPKRSGSKAHERFEGYFKGIKATKGKLTVADAVNKYGLTRGDIRWDVGSGHIELKSN